MGRIDTHTDAVRALLKDRGVVRDLERRGHRIAAAAGPDHEVQTWLGRNRARVTVRITTKGAAVRESRTHALVRAVDAARD